MPHATRSTRAGQANSNINKKIGNPEIHGVADTDTGNTQIRITAERRETTSDNGDAGDEIGRGSDPAQIDDVDIQNITGEPCIRSEPPPPQAAANDDRGFSLLRIPPG